MRILTAIAAPNAWSLWRCRATIYFWTNP